MIDIDLVKKAQLQALSQKKNNKYSREVERAKETQLANLNQNLAKRLIKQAKEQQKKLDYYDSLKQNPDWEEKSKISALDDLFASRWPSPFDKDKQGNYRYEVAEVIDAATEEETAIYNYLYQTDREKAREYFYDIQGGLKQANIDKFNQDLQKWADKNEFAGSAASVVTAIGSGAEGLMNLGEGVFNAIRGNGFTFDTTDDYMTHATNALREGASADMNVVGKFLYGTGMSILDNLARAPLGPAGAGLMAMGQAASQGMVQGKEMGMADWKAALYGITVGGIEGVTEAVSVDKLLDKTNLAKSVKGYILKNVIAEGSEEAISEVADKTAQFILAGDEAEWRKEYAAYIAKGYSKAEAIGLVVANTVGDVGLAALSGALSGGAMAGGGVALNAAVNVPKNVALGREVAAGANSTSELLAAAEAAKSTRIDNTARKMANAKTEIGRDYQRGKLTQQLMNEAYDRIHPYGDETETKDNGNPTHDAKVAQKKLDKANKKRTANGQQTIAEEFEQSDFGQKYSTFKEKIENYEDSQRAGDVLAEKGKIKADEDDVYNVSDDGKTYLIEKDEQGKPTLKETEVTEFSGVEGGIAQLKLSDGSVVSAKDVSLPADLAKQYKLAASYNDTAVAKAFLDGYSSYDGTIEAYAEEVKTAYLLGREAGERGIGDMIKTLPKAKQNSIVKNPATAAAFSAGKARAKKQAEDSAKMKKAREAKKSRSEEHINNQEKTKRKNRLTEADIDEYMHTGKTLHTRNKKQRMLEAGKKPVLTNENEIREFISNVITGNANGEIRAVGIVDDKLADAIMELRADLDLHGKYLELNADDLRESYKRHKNPKEIGDIPLEDSDFENLLEYVENFDGIISVNEYNGKIEIHIYDKSGKGYIRILAVASKERNSLIITKLIGVSKEKFEAKYAKKIERNAGSPKGQTDKTETSTPSTTVRHTASVLSKDSISEKSEKVNTSDEKTSAKKGKKSKKRSKGSFTISEEVDTNNLTPTQKKAIKRLQILSSCLDSVNIVVVDEGFDKEGVYQTDNGSYDPNTNTISISINAGKEKVDGMFDYALVETLSHEVVHFVKEHSEADYEKLKSFLQKNVYTAEQWNNLVLGRLEQYRKSNSDFTYEAAEEEVVANACQTMLNSPRVLAALAKGNYSLFERIKFRIADFFDNLIEKLGSNVFYTSEARLVQMSTQKMQKELENKFIEAVRNARSDTKSRAESTKNAESVNKAVKASKREGIDEAEIKRYNEVTDLSEGDVLNGQERAENKEGAETVYPGRERSDAEVRGGTQSKTGNRPRVQEAMGKTNETYTGDRTHRRLSAESAPFEDKDFVIPNQDSDLYRAQNELGEEYGIECHIVKSSSWNRETPATIYRNKIYVAEDIDSDLLATLVPHESTHGMKQIGFEPYLEFIERTTDMLNMRKQEFNKLMKDIKDHTHIDVFSLNIENENDGLLVIRFYDELNATVYGFVKGGIIDNSEYDYSWIPDAFNDFDAYISELDKIHEQFKESQRKAKEVSSVDSQGVKASKRERVETISREALANAFEGIAKTTKEKRIVQQYRDNLEKQNACIEDRRKLLQELTELRGQKGSEAASRRSELNIQIKNKTKQIVKYDEQLFNLQNSKPLKKAAKEYFDSEIEDKHVAEEMYYHHLMQKLKDKQKKELEAAKEKLEAEKRKRSADKERFEASKKSSKEKHNAELDTLKSKHKGELEAAKEKLQNLREDYRERRAVAKDKARINKVYKKNVDMLNKPDDKHFVPQYLIEPFSNLLELLRFDSGIEGAAQTKRNDIVQTLRNFAVAYGKLKNEELADYKQEYDESITEYFNALADLIENSGTNNVYEMDSETLHDVADLLVAVDISMREARNSILDEGKKTITGIVETVVKEQAEIAEFLGRNDVDDTSFMGKVVQTVDGWGEHLASHMLSPMSAAKKMSGYNENNQFYKLTQRFNEGKKKAAWFSMKSHKLFQDLTTGKNRKTFEKSKTELIDIGLKDLHGKSVLVTKQIGMQFLLSVEREESNSKINHVFNKFGGLLIPNARLLAKGDEQAAWEHGKKVIPTQENVQQMKDMLTEWDKQYMDLARVFFNQIAKDEVNATSLRVSHYEIAKETAYIPFTVDSKQLEKEVGSEREAERRLISSYGFTKTLTANAPQRLKMAGLNTTIEEHIDVVSKYSGFAAAVKDLNKVLKSKISEDSPETVSEYLIDKFGSKTFKVFYDAFVDVQSPRKSERNFFTWLQSRFVPAKLVFNFGTVLKQYSSIYNANAKLGNRWGTTTISWLSNLPLSRYDAICAEIDAHTPAHWERRQGLSVTEVGDLKSGKNGHSKILEVGIPIGKKGRKLNGMTFVNLIQHVDCVTAATIWQFSKSNIDKTGEYVKDSPEYWNAVTKLFEETLNETQATYDVFNRPEILKGDGFVKAITLFTTEEFKRLGILFDAVGKYKYARKTGNAKLISTAGKELRRAIVALLRSIISFVIVQTLVNILYFRLDDFLDDNGEFSMGETLGSLGELALEQIGGTLFPIVGSTAVELVSDVVTGDFYYKNNYISAPTLDFLNQVLQSYSSLGRGFDDTEKYLGKLWNSAALTTEALFGIPLSNFEKLVEAIKKWVEAIKDN